MIQGRIPDSMLYLRYLRLFDMHDTLMFCCGDGTTTCNRLGDPDCLPNYLQFEGSMVRPSLHPRQSSEPPANMKWVPGVSAEHCFGAQGHDALNLVD
jgi:hypothetical protein